MASIQFIASQARTIFQYKNTSHAQNKVMLNNICCVLT